jgi:tetratricopeptide (TPR) repeat protein
VWSRERPFARRARERALKLLELALTEPPSPVRGGQFADAAELLLARSRASGCSLDFQRAVQLAEEAVTITLAHEPDRARRLVILADVLSRRSQLGDLDRVIQLREDALTFTRMDDYLRPHQLNQLAKSLLLRSRHASSTADLDRAIQLEATALALSWVPSACNDGGGHLRVGRCSGNGYANVP